VTRRHILRAGGVALSLPFLESLAGAVPVTVPPRRFAFIYTPNGYHQPAFLSPAMAGARPLILAPSLQPLAKVREHVSLLSGLDRQFVPGTGVHAQCGSCWLTSSAPQETQDGAFPTHLTLDQLLARRLGAETALPSLELSTNDFTDNRETKYFECISWYGPGYAANPEKNPRAVFRRLFGQAAEGPSRGVLDLILADAKSLQQRLGRDDRQKLNEYLDSVRATEKRIQRAEEAARRTCPPPFPEPAGILENRGEYLRLMADLFIHAFRNDLTRVATLLVDPERWDSPRMYHGVFDKPQNHHVLTHTKDADAKAKLERIDRFHVAFFADVVERLRGIPEGTGTLLDSTTVAMGSGISDGDRHLYADLQVLLAGGGWKGGQHVHYEGRRPLADLWLTLARTAHPDLARFADSGGPLAELG